MLQCQTAAFSNHCSVSPTNYLQSYMDNHDTHWHQLMQLYPRVFSLGSPITHKGFQQLTSTSHGHQWMAVSSHMLVFPPYHEKNASACKFAPWNLGKIPQEIHQTHSTIWHPIQYAVLYVWTQASGTWTLPRSSNMVSTLQQQKTLHNAAAFYKN